MKKFLLILHEDIEKMGNLSPKEMEALVNAHVSWSAKLEQSDNLIDGNGLNETGVRLTGKEGVVKDGPYVESREMIGGYYLIQAETMDQAVQLAKECPCHIWGGTTEIRPLMEMEDYEQ